MTRKKAAVLLLILLAAAAAVAILWRMGYFGQPARSSEQAEAVREHLWSAEQYLYVEAGSRGSLQRTREELGQAVSLLNGSEEPLLCGDDLLDDGQYRTVCRYLSGMLDCLSRLPDDLGDVPDESWSETKSLLLTFCSTLRTDREASARPTLTTVLQNLQAHGTNYFLSALESGAL